MLKECRISSLKFHFRSHSLAHSLLLSTAVKFTTKQFVDVGLMGVKGLIEESEVLVIHARVCVCE